MFDGGSGRELDGVAGNAKTEELLKLDAPSTVPAMTGDFAVTNTDSPRVATVSSPKSQETMFT
jgi:hypothetical protein